MSSLLSSPPSPTGSLMLLNTPLAVKVAAALVGTLVLAASSHVSVPIGPVPMTMQTLAVTLIGALYGWRLGALTVCLWLLEGIVGLPVFAGGTSGAARLIGPTGGYLLAFPLAAALTGWLAERGWTGRRLPWSFLAMLLGHTVCLGVGTAWLATLIGVAPAIAKGLAPFLVGAVLKSILGAAVLAAFDGRTRAGAAG